MAKEKARNIIRVFCRVSESTRVKNVQGREHVLQNLPPNLMALEQRQGKPKCSSWKEHHSDWICLHDIKGLSRAQGSDTELMESLLAPWEKKPTNSVVWKPETKVQALWKELGNKDCTESSAQATVQLQPPAGFPVPCTNPWLQIHEFTITGGAVGFATPVILQALTMRKGCSGVSCSASHASQRQVVSS